VLASSEDGVVCSGEGCDALGSGEEEAALLQVHRANESGLEEKPWKNPCTGNTKTTILPKQSTKRDCEAAGLNYIGNQGGAPDAQQCCVSDVYVCSLGTKKYCKKTHGSPADPLWLGVITDQRGHEEGNCCLAPVPSTKKSATWTFTTSMAKEKDCKTTTVSRSCTVEAFFTGTQCLTSAYQNGKYSPAKCGKTFGKCSGVDIGEGHCCTCR